MKNHHRDFAHLRVVQPVERVQQNLGTAMVFGPFPPLTSPSSEHASALLHMFKTVGYKIVSATGPGLGMAGHQVNFTSNGRFEESSKFLATSGPIDVAVVYSRSVEFARISKPTWHERRLEEIRRFRFLLRTIDQAEKTCLILEDHPLKSRDELGFWVLGHAWSRLRGKTLQVKYKADRATDVLFDMIASGERLSTCEVTLFDGHLVPRASA